MITKSFLGSGAVSFAAKLPPSADIRLCLAKTLRGRRINDLESTLLRRALRYDSQMFVRLRHLLRWIISVCRSREELLLENLALRQQLLALHAKRPRPRLSSVDKLFWVVLRKTWSGWKRSLILVTPETVVRWHRAGFLLYWSWISRARTAVGRNPIGGEVRELIFRMVAENPTWGAPRIHGELLKLGFEISERTVSRWVKRASKNPDPAKHWLVFLRNHRKAIAAMDFFTVPTLTFGVLYCFFVIGHDRRKILHYNVTRNPNAFWIVQQLREAWGYDQPHRFLIFDRDAKFSADIVWTVQQNGTEPVRTAFRSPWQNGVAERWVGSVRRELLDHVIVLSQRHLRSLLKEYVRYYHEDRTHLGLGKDAPAGRVVASAPPSESKIVSLPRLGGLHHRYIVAA